MGTLRKKTYLRAMPKGATIEMRDGKPFAHFRSRGRNLVRPVAPDGRVVMECAVWIARYTDEHGREIERSTGCRAKDMATQKLAHFERDVERIKSGTVSAQEVKIAEHGQRALSLHLDDYLAALASRGTGAKHRHDTRRYVLLIAKACGFDRLAAFDSTKLERWMAERAKTHSGRSVNAARVAIVSFCEWLASAEPPRIARNPFLRVARATEEDKHVTRALDAADFAKLLRAAEARPLAAALAAGSSSPAKLSALTRARLVRRGAERRLWYVLLVCTKLRPGAIGGVRWEALRLDDPSPHVRVEKEHIKSGRAEIVPLSPFVVAEIRAWQAIAGKTGGPVITPPANPHKVFELDRKAAGIAKETDDGIASPYSLRHTYGTMLAELGADPWELKDALGHRSVQTSERHYVRLRASHGRAKIDAVGAAIGRALAPKTDTAAAATGTDGAGNPFPEDFPPGGGTGCNAMMQGETQGATKEKSPAPADMRETGDSDTSTASSADARGRARTFDPVIKREDVDAPSPQPLDGDSEELTEPDSRSRRRLSPKTSPAVEALARAVRELSPSARRLFDRLVRARH